MQPISRSEANLLGAVYAFLVAALTVWVGYTAARTDTPVGWVVFWCLGTLSLAVVPRVPAVALGAFVALAYAVPHYSTTNDTLMKLGVLDWFCALALLGGLVAWVSQPRQREKPSWLVWIMLAFVAWLAVTLAASLLRGTGWHPHAPGHNPVQQFFQALVLFLLAASFPVRPTTAWLLALTLCLALCLRAYLQEGVYLDNDLGAMLAVALPLAILGAWIARPAPVRIGFVLLGGLMLWLLIKTENRAGFVAFVVPLPLLWLQARHKVWVLAAAVPVLVIVGVLFAATGYQRFAGIPQSGTPDDRLGLWWFGWQMFLDHPLLGVGPGNYTIFLTSYAGRASQLEAHSNYMQLLAETGAPGLILYLALFGGALVILWRTAQRAGRAWPAPGARMVLGSLCAYLIVGCFLSRHDMVLAYLLAGWVLALRSELTAPKPEPTRTTGTGFASDAEPRKAATPAFATGGVAELAAAFAALGKATPPSVSGGHKPPDAPTVGTSSGGLRPPLAAGEGPPLARWMMVLCVFVLLYSALIPFQVDWNGLRSEAIQQKVNWKPYDDPVTSVSGLHFTLLNALANAAAGAVLGWFAFLACHRCWPGGLAWLRAVGIAAATAVGMEILQLVVPARDVTLTDVANLTLGGGGGALAAWGFAEIVGNWLKVRSLSALLARPAWLALLLWLAFLGLRAFFPDNVAASLGDLKGPVRKVNLVPGQAPGQSVFVQLHRLGLRSPAEEADVAPAGPQWTRTQYLMSIAGQVLLFALVGACLQQVRGREAASLAGTVLAVIFLAVGAECGKVFFPSQVVDVNTALASMAGGCLGAVVWLLLEQQGEALRWVYRATVVAYVVTQFLGPGRSLHAVPGHPSYDSLVPFAVYGGSPDALRILPDLLQGMILFLPVGWLAAAWARRQWPGKNQALLVAPLASVLLAGVLVLVQTALGRVPTIDDVLWAGLGGLLGGWLEAGLGREVDPSKAARR